MGRFAARVGDPTAHGHPLGPGPGCQNVRIAGMPAWRATIDTHSCPLTTPSAHGTGMVSLGSTRVRVGGLPLARVGDSVVEAGGGLNAILFGSTTVLVG